MPGLGHAELAAGALQAVGVCGDGRDWRQLVDGCDKTRPPASRLVQAEDGRWRPPDEHQPSANVAYRAPAGPAHFAGGARSPKRVTRRGWLRRIFFVVIAHAAVVSLSVIVNAAVPCLGAHCSARRP